jgi:hypothetical protein
MPVSTVDPTLRTITPDGLPLAILILSTVFLGLSIIAVGLRTYIRIVKGAFGLDDVFMVAGCVSLPVSNNTLHHILIDSLPGRLYRCYRSRSLFCLYWSRPRG